MRINLKERQNLIVVFTKADLLIHANDSKRLTDNLARYLTSGDYTDYLDIKDGRVSKMLEISSRDIQQWLIKKDCAGFVKIAEDKFKSVSYTIVSATGAAPMGNQLATTLDPKDPKRVLDPILWALKKSDSISFWKKIFGGGRKYEIS
jgi:hypothetical protein